VKPRFQADADLSHTIVLAATRHEAALDFQSAIVGEVIGLGDPEVLQRAADADRVLVTHDRRTMPHHFARFIQHRRSPGLIVVPQSLTISAVLDDLLLIWSATDADELVNRICVLPL
jgi:Domain of unknown function (DUF5615)